MQAGLAKAAATALQGAASAASCVDEACSRLLEDTLLAGPPPWDAGLIVARVHTSRTGGGRAQQAAGSSGGGGSPSSQQQLMAGDAEGEVGDLQHPPSHTVEFCALHTSPSFGIAYQGGDMAAPVVTMMRQQEASQQLARVQQLPTAGSKRRRGSASSGVADAAKPSIGMLGACISWAGNTGDAGPL